VKLFVLKNNLPCSRICFTFSRGFGNAVARNRARRLSREAFRLMKRRLSGGYDLILLVYPESERTFSERAGQLEFLFSKAGLLK
jgi:ribonuclease P protein component